MTTEFIKIFILAWILHFIWEEFHSRFYVHYKGLSITHAVLARAASCDAIVTVIGALLFVYVPPFQGQLWLTLFGLLVFAVGLEKFALRTHRWQYKPSMPIIPVLSVGLTPTIQLALIAYVSYFLAIPKSVF